jgi:branched-chain amino acid transport system substrate-binding protein
LKKRLVGLAVLVCLTGACETGAVSQEGPSIVIASDSPLSGSDGAYAAPVVQAIQLAITQHAQIGRFKVVYQPMDDAPALIAPVKGVQNVKRMIADARILGMVGPYLSSSAFEQIEVSNSASLAMVSPSNTNWCLTRPDPSCATPPADLRVTGTNNFFRITAPDSIEGRSMARFAWKTLQIKRAAVYTLGGQFEDVTLKGFVDEFQRDGGEVVFSNELPGSTTNFRPFLQTARSLGAETVFAATEGNDCLVRAQMGGIFPKDAYFLGMDIMQESSDCIPNAGANADGMIATVSVPDLAGSKDPAVIKFVDAYRKAYPRTETVDPYAFAAYDCALILIDAITQAVAANGGGFPTRLQVVSQIATSQFHELAGTYSFDANGDAVSPLMAVYQSKGGQWVYLGQIDASPTPA